MCGIVKLAWRGRIRAGFPKVEFVQDGPTLVRVAGALAGLFAVVALVFLGLAVREGEFRQRFVP